MKEMPSRFSADPRRSHQNATTTTTTTRKKSGRRSLHNYPQLTAVISEQTEAVYLERSVSGISNRQITTSSRQEMLPEFTLLTFSLMFP